MTLTQELYSRGLAVTIKKRSTSLLIWVVWIFQSLLLSCAKSATANINSFWHQKFHLYSVVAHYRPAAYSKEAIVTALYITMYSSSVVDP